MYEIIPGILEKEWNEIERKINLVKGFAPSNVAPPIHIDIIDGKFAPNTTFLDPAPFAQYSREIFFEVHLMVDEPINYLKPFAAAGFRRFLGHIEKMSNQVEFVEQGQLLGEVGLVIDGQTPTEALEVPLEDLDSILVMTIKAGESSQEFVPEYLKKVEILKQVQDDMKIDIKIEVDGGINDTTIIKSLKSGANRFIANSFIFNKRDPYNQYQILRKLIYNQTA